jgi:thymidylate kinase
MKIALIGTHGIGKTTIAHGIVYNLKQGGFDVSFLDEIARRCPFSINEETTKKSQIWMILTQIISEMELEEKCDILVSDRSVIDYYVYYVNKFGRSNFLEQIVKAHIKTYNLFLKIPLNKNFLKKDKLRSLNKQFQIDIDKKFDEILKFLNVKYINLKENESILNESFLKNFLKLINKDDRTI